MTRSSAERLTLSRGRAPLTPSLAVVISEPV
jgi:hypothetical protein